MEKLLSEEKQGEFLNQTSLTVGSKKMMIESYGCQMNFADSEVVATILNKEGYGLTQEIENANLILINTCAIRDNAEQKIRHRLKELQSEKKKNPELVVGIMGCMAERLKTQLIEEEEIVDIVVGPDAYRSLPNLIEKVENGYKAVDVLLSREETYDNIMPTRIDSNGVSAFVSIMRGCDNMCSFCVVPFTRGRERSRDPESILQEVKELHTKGYKEITLLGQNVDSYKWKSENETVNFARLLELTATVDKKIRIRFSTSHPKDMTDEVLHVMAKYKNICKYIHLPVQSGNTEILNKMNRGYSREWYLNRISAIRTIMPDCAISTDIIAGFCSETEEQHQDTLSLMDEVKYDFAYMFFYSERPKTLAARKYPDDVDIETKKRRLNEIIQKQKQHSHESNLRQIGKIHEVLVEGPSKKNKEEYCGRTTQNTMVVFPKKESKKGDYVNVKINSCTSATLIGEIIY
jgi:tRNA-2-methylthio-N6-dimethylallyladenosine synthase